MGALLRRIGFLAIGLGLLAWIFLSVDLGAVLSQIRGLNWRFALIVGFYPVIFGLDTLGWRYALAPGVKVRWDRLFRARLAGEAMNYLTPMAGIGGEPVKAMLLSERYGVPISYGLASVVVAKTTFVVSMIGFALTGLAVAAFTHPVGGALIAWVWMVLGTMGILVAGFVTLQLFQPLRRSAGRLNRLIPERFRALSLKLQDWERQVADFYRQEPAGLARSLIFHYLGWLAGAVEVYLILHLMQIEISFATAISIEALWVLLRSGAFLIPATIGASEGVALAVCLGMGLTAVSGLGLALVRRARELLWVGLGLAEFAWG